MAKTKAIYILYAVALLTAVAAGIISIVEGDNFNDIVWPFIAAMWIVISILQESSIRILKEIIKLLEK